MYLLLPLVVFTGVQLEPIAHPANVGIQSELRTTPAHRRTPIAHPTIPYVLSLTSFLVFLILIICLGYLWQRRQLKAFSCTLRSAGYDPSSDNGSNGHGDNGHGGNGQSGNGKMRKRCALLQDQEVKSD